MAMILTEYNEKLHNKTLKEEEIEIGEKRGIEQTITLANTVFNNILQEFSHPLQVVR